MSRADDFVFLAGDGSESAPGDEVLDVGRRRRGPRWLWPGVAAVLAVLVAGVLVSRAGSHRAPSAAASSGPTVMRGPPPAAQSSVGPPLDVGSGAAVDVVAAGQHTWVLHADRLAGLAIAAGHDRTVRLPPFDLSSPNATLRLVLDPTATRLWVVLAGTRPGRAIEFDLWTLARLRDVLLPAINSAAALGGHLYATSGKTLIDVAPDGAPRSVPVPGTSGLWAIAADPTRSRLIILDGGFPTHAWSYRSGAGVQAIPGALPFGKGSIAVTKYAIWVGGFAQHGAVLERLDPNRLRAVLASPVAARLGPGAVLLSGGTRDVWVVAGDGRSGVWCVDGQSGEGAQFWPLTLRAVAADEHRLVAVVDGQVLPLLLNGGCVG